MRAHHTRTCNLPVTGADTIHLHYTVADKYPLDLMAIVMTVFTCFKSDQSPTWILVQDASWRSGLFIALFITWSRAVVSLRFQCRWVSDLLEVKMMMKELMKYDRTGESTSGSFLIFNDVVMLCFLVVKQWMCLRSLTYIHLFTHCDLFCVICSCTLIQVQLMCSVAKVSCDSCLQRI